MYSVKIQSLIIYKNEDDDKYEYENSKGIQEKLSLEDKVEIHEPLEDEDVIKEIVEDEYHKEDLNIISEESDNEVEEGDNVTLEYDTDEEDVIVEKPSKNEYDEEIPSTTGEGIIELIPPVSKNKGPQISIESRNRQ